MGGIPSGWCTTSDFGISRVEQERCATAVQATETFSHSMNTEKCFEKNCGTESDVHFV
jgi:hypothetical protein